MPVATPARVTPSSVVDFDPRHEIVLLCSDANRAETSELAELLLAQGYDAHVVAGPLGDLVAGLERMVAEPRPALLVACDEATDTAVLRSRVKRAFEREHRWLAGHPGPEVLELQRKIQNQMDALELASTQELPIELDDEPSNVVRFPLPAPAPEPTPTVEAPTAPAPRPAPAPAPAPKARSSRASLLVWPLIGAGLTALGMTAFRGASDEPDPVVAPDPSEPVATAEPASPPPPPAPVLAAAPEPAPDAAPEPASTPAVEPAPAPPAEPAPADPMAAALSHERVTVADGLLVFVASERSRDWYAAMNLCRGRTHAGVSGWSTPSSRQLNALAKQRVLPDAPLWSRSSALHVNGVAFIVDGQAGTTQRTAKTETVTAAVCVRKRDDR